VLAVRTSRTVEEARLRHETTPVATAALGRALTAAALLGALLKGKETVTLRIIGDGPLGGVIADADAEGNVRGYVKNPRVDLPLKEASKLDVGAAIGRRGFLHVTRDLGLKEPYTGSCPLVSGEIAEDLARYFAHSEQIPSACALGVRVNREGVVAAGGLLVQVLPGTEDLEDKARMLEENLKGLGAVSSLIEEGASPEDLVAMATRGVPTRILGAQEVRFRCRCSRERIEEVLVSLPPEQLAELLSTREGSSESLIEACCHFCRERYRFRPEELARDK